MLAGLSEQRRPGQTLVGFAAEHGSEAVELGRGKLVQKGLDAIVVNDISRADIGFDANANEVTILTAAANGNGEGAATIEVGRAPKSQVAEEILDAVWKLRDAR